MRYTRVNTIFYDILEDIDRLVAKVNGSLIN